MFGIVVHVHMFACLTIIVIIVYRYEIDAFSISYTCINIQVFGEMILLE